MGCQRVQPGALLLRDLASTSNAKGGPGESSETAFDHDFLHGGAKGTRTPDPLPARQVLYQLSYGPGSAITLAHRARTHGRHPAKVNTAHQSHNLAATALTSSTDWGTIGTTPEKWGVHMKIARMLDDKGSFVATVSPEDTVLSLCQTLSQYNIGAVVVSADGRTVDGIASERDVIRQLAAHGPDILDGPVAEIMTETVACAELDNNTDDLMLTMTERRIRHVPVLKDDQLAGIVSIGDVVRVTLAQLEDEKATLLGYITS